jgi:hypothetical protein
LIFDFCFFFFFFFFFKKIPKFCPARAETVNWTACCGSVCVLMVVQSGTSKTTSWTRAPSTIVPTVRSSSKSLSFEDTSPSFRVGPVFFLLSFFFFFFFLFSSPPVSHPFLLESGPKHTCDACGQGIVSGTMVTAEPFHYHETCCKCQKCGIDLNGEVGFNVFCYIDCISDAYLYFN